ncbi:MAG TPA: CAP domain-containing protein [Cytophagaceae bacterium]
MKPTYFLFFLFAICSWQNSFGQEIAIDKEILKTLILQRVNKVRYDLKLSELQQDSTLHLAAQCQADYQRKKGELSHTQNKNKFATPPRRVKYFRGEFRAVAENCAFVPLKIDTASLTVEQLAGELVDGWINSPGHYKNIIADDMRSSGIGISYDKKANRVYAVQVFGLKTKTPSNISLASIKPYSPSACKDFEEKYRTLPGEAQFNVFLQDEKVMLYHNDLKQVKKLINKPNDAIIIDVVEKEIFPCENENFIDKASLFIGEPLSPMTKDLLYAKNLSGEKNNLFVDFGSYSANGKDVEFNISFVKNRRVCKYVIPYPIAVARLDLLEMGLYRDSLKNVRIKNTYTLNSSEIKKYSIIYPKSGFLAKYGFINDLEDSLRKDRFTISYLNVKAYSSIEGDSVMNKQLQEKRALGVVERFQKLQKDSIRTNIKTFENWEQFYADIKGTPFAKYKSMSKVEMKRELRKQDVLDALEPILAKHRRSDFFIKIDRTQEVSRYDTTGMLKIFKQSINQKNLQEALEVQQLFLQAIENKSLPDDYLDSLEVPEVNIYARLLSNEGVFRYHNEVKDFDLEKAFQSFSKLAIMIPGNPYINYNLLALKIQRWALARDHLIDIEQMSRDINRLQSSPLEKKLIRRMLINYHLLAAHYFLNVNDYRKVKQSVQFIWDQYKYLRHSETDLLKLAHFFSWYRRYDYAEKLLYSYVLKEEAGENLIFYYLNLTLNDEDEHGKSYYLPLLKRAFALNRERFCEIFSSKGISFQLLRFPMLKDRYCDACN